MQVGEPARTKKYEKYVGAGMAEQRAREKPLKEPCGRLKAIFSTPTRNSWKQSYSLNTIVLITRLKPTLKKKLMHPVLDSRKAVKSRHQFENLFEYKSDDEDDSDRDADSLEDGLDRPHAKRTWPLPSY